MELSDPLLSAEVQSRLLHCTTGWTTNTAGVCVCVLSHIYTLRNGVFGNALFGGEERKEGLDGILVTCSGYWLHFCAEAKVESRGEENKERREDERRKMLRGI